MTILMTTHYLDEAERLCDRLAVIDAGTVVACDSPASLLASMGDEILELRVDQTDRAAKILYSNEVVPQDVLVIAGTVTASLRGIPGTRLIQLLNEDSITVRSVATVGGPTFDGNLASLAPRGVLAIYGQPGGPIPPFDPARLVQAGSVYLTRTSLVHYARTPKSCGHARRTYSA